MLPDIIMISCAFVMLQVLKVTLGEILCDLGSVRARRCREMR